MQLFDPNNPSERKKAIVAGILAIVAIAVLGYVFFGSSGTTKKPQPELISLHCKRQTPLPSHQLATL
jgi:hypothetical protein